MPARAENEPFVLPGSVQEGSYSQYKSRGETDNYKKALNTQLQVISKRFEYSTNFLTMHGTHALRDHPTGTLLTISALLPTTPS